MITTTVTWARLRELVRRRDKSICYHCGAVAEDGHCDHLVPVSKGGTDSINNLVWSCGTCNTEKSNKSEIEFVLTTKNNRNYPRFRENIWKCFWVEVVKLIIQPYPEYSAISFQDMDSYQNKIKQMRNSKIATWVREIIWVTPVEAKGSTGLYIFECDPETQKPTPEEREIAELLSMGNSRSAAARKVLGNDGGNQLRKVDKIAKKLSEKA